MTAKGALGIFHHDRPDVPRRRPRLPDGFQCFGGSYHATIQKSLALRGRYRLLRVRHADDEPYLERARGQGRVLRPGEYDSAIYERGATDKQFAAAVPDLRKVGIKKLFLQ